jgi:hypothetical protein
LILVYKSDSEVESKYEIFDAVGKVILSGKFNLKMGVNKYSINVKDLQQGAYFIRINSSVQSFAKH